MRKKTGFTLIEIMIVVTVIAILCAIALPNMLRARVQTNEASAVQSIRAVVSAETAYNTQKGSYSTGFTELTDVTPPYLPPYINGNWTNSKNGYRFQLGGDENNYTINADPVAWGASGNRGFFCDSTGVIRYEEGNSATDTSLPIGENT